MRTHRLVFYGHTLFGIAFALLCAASQWPVVAAGADGATVRIESGLVSAIPSDGVIAYKGIPYAAPPVGDLRWRAPQPVAKWTDVRSAEDFGMSCPQARPDPRVPEGSRGARSSEDCLTLNVWTPATRPTGYALPVMVWIHGGGNDAGTASDRYMDGGNFARDGVVLVSFNYRLGALGFFAHRAIVDEAGSEPTGNFGLLDQIAALRWVHTNIAAFGGDPANVTLFGESAGGLDAVTLAESPMTTGLFERVIAESAGGLWSWPSLPDAEKGSAKIATSVGLSGERATAAELRALPADKLASLEDELQIGPFVDGHVVTESLPASGLRNVRVPIVIGTNAGDGSLVDGYADYGSLFPKLTKSDLAIVKASYAARNITTDAAITSQLFGDGYFAAPSRWVAAQVTAAGQSAYLYRFDYVLSGLRYRRTTATHGSEIPFVFENWPLLGVSDTDRAVGSALHDCWIAFARTGKPDCAAAGHWPAYDSKTGKIMVFDEHPSYRTQADTDVLRRLQERLLGPS